LTRRTFYKKLSESTISIKWEVNSVGCIRGNHSKFCPITGLADHLGYGFFEKNEADLAGRELKLSDEDTVKIMEAADDGGNKQIRRVILRALSLTDNQ
jgi:hypothetical protein